MTVCANQNNLCVGVAVHAISKLCPGQANKNLLVDGSAEPCYGGTLGWREGKWI